MSVSGRLHQRTVRLIRVNREAAYSWRMTLIMMPTPAVMPDAISKAICRPVSGEGSTPCVRIDIDRAYEGRS